MPIIHIEIARGRTADQLQELGSRVSRAAAESLSVSESTVRVLVSEVDPALWFSGGQSLVEKRRSPAT